MRVLKIVRNVIITSLVLFVISCKNDDAIFNISDLQLEVDTLRFDTLLANTISITQSVKLYNTSNQPIVVEKIFLDGDSPFRFNVNGLSSINDFRIEANDSAYVFVDVYPTHTNSNPMTNYTAKLNFVSGSSTQSLHLIATTIFADTLGAINDTLFIECDGGIHTLTSERPYIVKGTIVVKNCQLDISPGTSLYFNSAINENGNKSQLVVEKNGSLHINGTVTQPVFLKGDRLDPILASRSGQWGGIIIKEESNDNTISHARIIGADKNLEIHNGSAVTITNSIISNATYQNIQAENANVSITNSLIYGSSNGYNVDLLNGGNYQLSYVTVSALSEGIDGGRCLKFSNTDCIIDPTCDGSNSLILHLVNSIISGPSEEILDLTQPLSNNQILIEHSLINTSDSRYNANNNIVGVPANFISTNTNNFTLNENSRALGKAKSISIVSDFYEVPRDPQAPDIGAIER